ncbi:unnamed protein product [Lota lota]
MNQMLGARGHSHTGNRITVRELIKLHRRPACGKVRTPLDRLTRPNVLEGNRPHPVNPARQLAAYPPSRPRDAASCLGVSTICQPYVKLSPPQRAPDLPAVPGNGSLSLFQWQLLQESRRLGDVTEDMLAMQDEDGDTCLHIAVAQGKRALAYALAKKSSGSIDTTEHNGQTALHIAVITNQHLIVQDLLLLGAKVNSRDHWGRSPLHVCAERGYALTLETIRKTLSFGDCKPINIELVNYEGLTPLHVAVSSYNSLVRELRKLSAKCSLVAMELARRKEQYINCVRTLLLMGAQCGTKDLKNGKNILHLVSEEAKEELFDIVLNHPSSSFILNEKTYSGNTALHIVSSLARDEGSLKALAKLLTVGADAGARNCENDQPVHLVPHSPIVDKVRKMIKGQSNFPLYLTVPEMQKRCQLDSSTFY